MEYFKSAAPESSGCEHRTVSEFRFSGMPWFTSSSISGT
jgi:hypothetical protein